MKPKLLMLSVAALLLAACGPGGGGGGGVSGCNLSGSISSQVTLSPSACSPYHVTGDVTIENTGKLVIQPGTTLEFAQDTGITVSGHGALVAVGTAADKILFTGASHVRGYWDGLTFDAANSFDNELKYVEIEYAGGEQRWDGGAYGHYRAAVDLQSDSRLKMTYSIVRESAGSGLRIGTDVIFGSDDTPDGDFAHNTITANASYPVIMYTNQVGFLDASNDFTGNDAGYDYVRASGNYDYIATQTWQNLNVPYRILDWAELDDYAVLTIEPGATLVFEQDAALEAYGTDSAIYAVGTAAEPITFTAVDHHAGYWYGLVFNDTNNHDNALHYVTVEYGGAESDPELKANIAVISSGNASSQWIEVKNSTIRHSSGHGISVAPETHYNSDITTSNTFSDIAGENVHTQP